jgi:hypothetical protein
MKTYLIEYVYPKTCTVMSTYIEGKDKNEAINFFTENFPEVNHIERITWVPNKIKNLKSSIGK